jgi:hypothetical protein
MSWHLVAALVGSGLYGLLYLVAGLFQLRNPKLELWMGMLLAFSGTLVAFSAVLLKLGASNAPWVLATGLLGIHWMTWRNGMMLYGKITRSHHLVRLAISLVLLGLTIWGLY